MLVFLLLVALVSRVAAECPNACSAHGKCGAYDMCSCYRNWMANDCSERICQFGIAHVDTPMGDLDASSGVLSGPSVNVVTNNDMYPYGTSEQFPHMWDSNQNILTNSAHYYRECSNKGICDRSAGVCQCIDGYEGSACQRASCPTTANGMCNGKGTCETIKTIANMDHQNVYNLWDEYSTMGCVCEGGYTGPDCSQRICKTGVDPLYVDDFPNARIANFTVQFWVTVASGNPTGVIYGNYSLVFTDATNEEWQTVPIDIFSTCDAVINALEGLPNNVVPKGSVLCYRPEFAFHTNCGKLTNDADAGVVGYATNILKPMCGFNTYTADTNKGQSTDVASGQSAGLNTNAASIVYGAYGVSEVEPIFDVNMYVAQKYTIAFTGNPGAIPQIGINKYLDGSRPTLMTTDPVNRLTFAAYPNGFIGEEVDMVPDECSGVLVTLSGATASSGYHTLAGLDAVALRRLKICLGDSDGVVATNVEVYNWDYGNSWNPHLIKLIDATQDISTEYIRSDGTTYKIPDAYARNPGTGTGTNSFGTSSSGSTGNSGVYQDSVLYDYPMTKLCSNAKAWQFYKGAQKLYPYGGSGASGTGAPYNPTYLNFGWCHNINPPGFFAVIWWDTTAGLFKVYTRAAQDYATTTKFHVFTTTGTLQRISADAHAFTATGTMSTLARTNTYFSNTVYTTNVTNTFNRYDGNIDCETNYASPPMASNIINNGAHDCLNKNDLVMFLNVGQDSVGSYAATANQAWSPLMGSSTAGIAQGQSGNADTGPKAASLLSNPVYPNIYTVKKIWRDTKADNKNGPGAAIEGNVNSELMRHQIILDYGMNARYMYNGGPALYNEDSTAAIFKFYPPTNAYNYADECSNRGICDTTAGTCTCFAGFTGDACDQINALAL